MRRALAASAALAAAASGGARAQQQPTVTTPDGPVVGFTQEGVDAFRGIPYAAPPTGDLRFRPPQPPTSWTSPLDATQWPPSCLQRGAPGAGSSSHGPLPPGWPTINVTVAGEDCLYANVYAPSRNQSSNADAAGPLPVMVYFHAGEFRFGSSHDAENAWPFFAQGRVILVTANVRLGLLGFGALDALRARDPTGNSTGNYGVQDQRRVLQWVQRSISAFGGDPARVTIFGESSGGSSVGFHLSSARSAGLFAGAILESPGLTQSHPWEASEGNTQMAVAALTTAKSSHCNWPANASADTAFLTLPGVVPSDMTALGTATSLDAARTACLASDACMVVGTKEGVLGKTYTTYGLEGPLLSAPPAFYNYTARAGAAAASAFAVDIRLSDQATAADCLVNADAGTLVSVLTSPPFGDTFSTDAAAPTEDGVELALPLVVQATQHPNKDVAVLGGANLDEGTEFMGDTATLKCDASATDFAQWCSVQFPIPDLAAAVPAAYADLQQPVPECRQRYAEEKQQQQRVGADDTSQWSRAMRAAGESAILCPTRELLKASRAAGQANTYWYQFTATPIYSANMGNLAEMGSFHGAEVPFVFGDQFELKSDAERALSAAMGCYWTNFAATGNPNNGSCVNTLGLAEWPVIGAHGDAMQFSNATTVATPVTALKEARCDLFAKYKPYQ